ncbi:MAG: metallophosphoesterase [Propionibacteriaceae bacterium]|nr:metallophosphoesterase [Propionibacteriaceae bacterium]
MSLFSALFYVTLITAIGGFLVFCFTRQIAVKGVAAVMTIIWVVLLVVSSFMATILTRTLGTSPYRLIILGASTGLAVVFYLCLGLAVVSAVNLIWWLRTRQTDPRRSNRLGVVRLLTVIVLVLSLVTTGYGFARAAKPEVNDIELSFDGLPSSFDGMKIALIADLHIGVATRNSFLPMVVNQVNAAAPDLIIIAGDLVNGSVSDLGDTMSILAQLSAPYGVVVTIGNHELHSGAEQWITYFRSLGLRVLVNQGILLTSGTDSIEILGINDNQGTGNLAPDLPTAYQRVNGSLGPSDAFQILVAHKPGQLFDDDKLVSRWGIDLQLSGHTHGGQLFPFHLATYLQQHVVAGVHEFDGVTLVTTRGIGTWGPPVRVLADPEIPIITLHRSGHVQEKPEVG